MCGVDFGNKSRKVGKALSALLPAMSLPHTMNTKTMTHSGKVWQGVWREEKRNP